ncbi:MAG: HAD-IA family hydrolase [Candidatus Norongarragalinales archaeon]
METKAILFDADGVLLDSHEAVARTFAATLSRYGFPKKTKKQIMKWNGLSDEEWIKKIVPPTAARNEALMLEAARFNRAQYASYTMLKYAKPARGVVRALHALRSAGLRLGVVTNQGKREVRVMQRVLGFRGFDVVVTADDVRKPKPSPEGVLKALRLLRVSPAEALFIGDSTVDEATARAAGVRFALVGKQVKTLAELPALVINGGKRRSKRMKRFCA